MKKTLKFLIALTSLLIPLVAPVTPGGVCKEYTSQEGVGQINWWGAYYEEE